MGEHDFAIEDISQQEPNARVKICRMSKDLSLQHDFQMEINETQSMSSREDGNQFQV